MKPKTKDDIRNDLYKQCPFWSSLPFSKIENLVEFGYSQHINGARQEKERMTELLKEEGEKLKGKTDEYSNGGYCMLVVMLNKINKIL